MSHSTQTHPSLVLVLDSVTLTDDHPICHTIGHVQKNSDILTDSFSLDLLLLVDEGVCLMAWSLCN